MKYTDNLGLKKPDLTDYVNVEDFNENADTIDLEIDTAKKDLSSHKAEIMQLKFSELSSTATNLDSEDIYINAEWRRKDNTLYAKSTLLGTTPNYNQIKIDYYDDLGALIIKTIKWNLSYDENDFIYKKVVV